MLDSILMLMIALFAVCLPLTVPVLLCGLYYVIYKSGMKLLSFLLRDYK